MPLGGVIPEAPLDALAIDPATPTTLYAGTDGGGVFHIQQAELQTHSYLPLVVRRH